MMRTYAKAVAHRAFIALDRVGLHVLPKHFYTSIPDYSWLREHEDVWWRPVSILGLEWNLDAQVGWLEEILGEHLHEVAGFPGVDEVDPRLGAGLGPIETQVLHCFVRTQRPPRILEIGGGFTLGVMARASALNAADGRRASKIQIAEPFPSQALTELPGIELIPVGAQELPPALFEGLEAGDLLFIDSTHAVKTGSEVPRLYLELVPRLAPGVFVHVHDVNYPFLHHRSFTCDFFDWQEGTLVLALLIGNARLRVLCCQSALHYARQDDLRRLLPDYRPEVDDRGLRPRRPDGHFPSSLWMVTA